MTRGDQKGGFCTLGSADDANTAWIDLWLVLQPGERRTEILERDQFEPLRLPWAAKIGGL